MNAFQSEWLKKKNSLGSWLLFIGACFTPVIIIVARLVKHDRLPALYSADAFWTLLWRDSWESMAVFFLPMAAILVTSLITQIEFKNNAWKQVHTLPLTPTAIYFSKLLVILLMMVEFFILFDVGIYLSAVVPYVLVGNVNYPGGPLPLRSFSLDTVLYFLDCLPIVSAQYLLSLRFKNPLAPIGLGFMTWVGALAAVSWRLGAVVPYTYTMLNYLRDVPKTRAVVPMFNIHLIAASYFVLFTLLGYFLFVTNKQKG